MKTLAELDFGHTVAADALSALFTAVLVGLAAGLVVRWFEARNSEIRQTRSLEHQTRAALRETYAQLLVAQRRSRQASLELAQFDASSSDPQVRELAESTHSEFIDVYHRLNLDASEEMWHDARALREVLDDMLKCAGEGNIKECERLMKLARYARQNLERSFRIRLGYKPLQKRRDLGDYDKGEE